jgi:exonuclease SbcD
VKVLFSTDWHLGYEMGGAHRADRLPDQLRQLRLIASYLESHDIDVLAVAGDVFEAQERGRARLAVQAMMHMLQPSLERGLQMIMIAGNHDRDYFMETANVWLNAQTPVGGRRVILATKPQVVVLEAKGECVSFVLLPFPTPTRYDLHDIDPRVGAGLRNEQVTRGYIAKMEELRREAAGGKHPVVLLTHITVEGTEVGPHRLSPRDDVVVPRSAFPSFEMTAVGHIHKPEKLGSSHFYYVGVLDRMDIAEMNYPTRALLADIGPEGVRGEVQSLPLDPTLFAEINAESEADLESHRQAMARPDETLVKLRLHVPYGTYTAPLISAAEELFPRLYGNVQHEWTGMPAVAPTVEGLDPRDVNGSIQRYLEEQVQDIDERAQLLALVQELNADVRPT